MCFHTENYIWAKLRLLKWLNQCHCEVGEPQTANARRGNLLKEKSCYFGGDCFVAVKCTAPRNDIRVKIILTYNNRQNNRYQILTAHPCSTAVTACGL